MEESFWRDYDLTARKDKIIRAFANEPIRTADDVPIITSTGNYFGSGGHKRPVQYWEDPAVMLEFQTDYFTEHMANVNDDMIPYFMPWFGTGVLASGFGCKTKHATGNGDDPAVVSCPVEKPSDVARLKQPDPNQDGLMPKALSFIEYARKHGDLPVGPTDLNSPLCTAAQICGYDNLFVWMYEEPNLVHDLMEMITEAFIKWVKLQKEYIGEPLNQSNALQGVWSPEGIGVWISDDDLVSVSPGLYEEFVVPYYSRLFNEFEGGSLHYCGVGTHHLDNFGKITGLRAINNSPMGKAEAFRKLVEGKPKGTLIQIQDSAPENPKEYYGMLFSEVRDFTGIMVATWVCDTIAVNNSGGYTFVDWDIYKVANKMVGVIREIVAQKQCAQEQQ